MKRNTEAIARGLVLPRQHKAVDIADWSKVDSREIQDAIAAVAAKGGALRFGYTRDGGAYAIGIYGAGEPYTEYLRPSEDVAAYLGALAAAASKDQEGKAPA